MQTVRIRNYQPGDGAAMLLVQKRHLAEWPDTSLTDPGFYRAPGFADGQNIFLACQELEGAAPRLIGYSWIYPSYVSATLDGSQVLAIDLKVDPEFPEWRTVREELLEAATQRAREIQGEYPRRCILSVTYFATGEMSLEYFRSKGFQLYESGYTMRRDLSQPVDCIPLPTGVEVRPWRMETEEEQQEYLGAYEASFHNDEWSLPELQHFMRSDFWSVGSTLSAFAHGKVIGSAMVYYDPDFERNREKIGYTEHVFVLPEWRGKGLARHMVCQALGYLQEHGLAQAELQVYAKNRAALGLYEGAGYVVYKEQHSLYAEVSEA